MERSNMMKAMKASISDVLGTMFFQLVQITDDNKALPEWLAQEQALLGATLGFDGPSSGSFYFLIPKAAASIITANFLGLNTSELDEKQQQDTIKEALNMIGGGTLSMVDSEGAYKLGLPELIETNSLNLNKLEDLKGDFILFKTEENRLAAGIVVD